MTGRIYYCPHCADHLGEDATDGKHCARCGCEVQLV